MEILNKDQNTSSIKHGKECELYICLKNINKNKLDNYPVTAGQGLGWPEPVLAAQGVREEPTLDSMPFNCRMQSHAHSHSSDWGPLDMPVNLKYTTLGCGRKPESQEKTHPGLGRIGKLHTDSGPASIFFFPSSTL